MGRCEENLIAGDACGDFKVLVGEDDLMLEELEPGCCGRTEDNCTELLGSMKVTVMGN